MPDRPIHHRIAAHVRGQAVGYVAIFLLALGVGGGYAIASSKTKTITVCADKKTGVLHLKTRGRCKHSQTRVSWNQQGPQGARGPQGTAGISGPAGAPGAQGPQGPAAVSIWAQVAGDGSVLFGQGQGLNVQRVSAGTYQVTITDPACAHGSNAPVVSVSDSNPPNGQNAGAFPVAWYGSSGANQQFIVFTGIVVGGSFTATDHTFDVQDACQ